MPSHYIGETLIIEEMPQGCVITPITRTGEEVMDFDIAGDSVVVSSKDDAIEVIESLERMLKVQFGVART